MGLVKLRTLRSNVFIFSANLKTNRLGPHPPTCSRTVLYVQWPSRPDPNRSSRSWFSGNRPAGIDQPICPGYGSCVNYTQSLALSFSESSLSSSVVMCGRTLRPHCCSMLAFFLLVPGCSLPWSALPSAYSASPTPNVGVAQGEHLLPQEIEHSHPAKTRSIAFALV